MSSVDIREVLKLQERNMSLRQIANRLGLHHTTVSRWLQRAKELGLDFQTVSKIQDKQLHSLFCKVKRSERKKLSIRLMSKLYVTPSIKEEQKFLIPTCSTLSKRRLLICRRSNARGFITESSNTGTRITEIKDASWLRNGSRENIC